MNSPPVLEPILVGLVDVYWGLTDLDFEKPMASSEGLHSGLQSGEVSWPEGFKLAAQMGYKFPQPRPRTKSGPWPVSFTGALKKWLVDTPPNFLRSARGSYFDASYFYEPHVPSMVWGAHLVARARVTFGLCAHNVCTVGHWSWTSVHTYLASGFLLVSIKGVQSRERERERASFHPPILGR